jgi:hypothetical protein
VDFVRNLLLFLHLLGMAGLVGMFLLQLRAGAEAALSKGWLHAGGLQLGTGLALQGTAPLTHHHYNQIKLGIKLLVLIVIVGLAVANLRRRPIPRWLNPTFGSLIVLNVGIAVFWG